ncbi:MAG: M3 family metallopeptidase [Gammaproteobacteria bacterium]|nr:M3 family metallopeptidase [Gammaproteobacteria bacterium]
MRTTIHNLPDHQAIRADEVVANVDELIESHEAEIEQIIESAKSDPTFDNVMIPLEYLDVVINDMWAPISHLNAVVSNDELREAHDAAEQKLSEHSTRLSQSRPLYEIVKALSESERFDTYDVAQQKMINDSLRTFRRNGVALDDADRERFKNLRQKITLLNSTFSNNLLDATDAWTKHISDVDDLKGIPEANLAVARAAAERQELDGYVLTLDMACYASTMMHCESRTLREEMYHANVTRASDVGPDEGKYDNSQVIEEILLNRTEMAALVGFDCFAEYSIDPKMASSTEEVKAFLDDLLDKALPQAQEELERMRVFAKDELEIDSLEPWDLNFVAERMRESLYDVSDAQLKPYFPLDDVVEGMFEVVEGLFNVQISRTDAPSSWHEDVRYYEIARDNEVIARFYLDAFAREKKRGGAWMADCRSRRAVGNEFAIPVAYLTCNFTPPIGGKPSLLTHTEVVTLFHEFGHGLHHMLTQQTYSTVSGINGVEWDAVELPSQFMENWCWQTDSLRRISRHFETGEALPGELLNRLIEAKNFNSGMAMVRQLEFGLLDLALHMQTEGFDALATMRTIRKRTGMLPNKDYDRFPWGFAHIFAGGYAAGYYSYLWAEVLSADAFAAFEEEGLENRETSTRFLHDILEVGSSIKASEMFANFRGRPPQNDALLRHCGIRN